MDSSQDVHHLAQHPRSTTWSSIYDGRELISSHNLKQPGRCLSIVKWNIEFNETFKLFYGDWSYFAKKYGKWREDFIELGFRSMGLREPTIDTTGAEISKTGGHYDVIIVDDIQNRENVRSEVERENVRGRMQEYFPQLQPYGGLLMPGNAVSPQRCLQNWIERRGARRRSRRCTNPEFLLRHRRAVGVERRWIALLSSTRAHERVSRAARSVNSKSICSRSWYRNQPIDDATKVFVEPRKRERDFDFIRDEMPYIELPNGTRFARST